MSSEPEWLLPASLDEALALRAEQRERATVVAGGTFVGILVNSRLMAPDAFLSLQRVAGLDYSRAGAHGELRIGALTTREQQVLAQIAQGKTSKQIAAELGISLRTVNTHREKHREKDRQLLARRDDSLRDRVRAQDAGSAGIGGSSGHGSPRRVGFGRTLFAG